MGKVLSVRSVPRYYKRNKRELQLMKRSELVSELDNRWGSVLVSCYCEKLVDEARR
jgi:hypothetical protein